MGAELCKRVCCEFGAPSGDPLRDVMGRRVNLRGYDNMPHTSSSESDLEEDDDVDYPSADPQKRRLHPGPSGGGSVLSQKKKHASQQNVYEHPYHEPVVVFKGPGHDDGEEDGNEADRSSLSTVRSSFRQDNKKKKKTKKKKTTSQQSSIMQETDDDPDLDDERSACLGGASSSPPPLPPRGGSQTTAGSGSRRLPRPATPMPSKKIKSRSGSESTTSSRVSMSSSCY
ncbi:myristylated tegument protein [Panine betaherpesvirus 2]|uniref:Cytoplasmic envelopment protein 3 n=1 Tax=Panine betaherpesvirus 2 TaxID=188763 RepID=Q8QS01_9BETA|nr:myristylated tegument protein [Panine betaherpesvirus 2]AAM00737.1 myristylated tegument protein [Panine betaherpesvirus 2]QXV67848.1 myristylated tegument protein [Panine betaherpesvirus 2]